MNEENVGAGLVHKFVVESCALESLVSLYHSFTEDAGVRRGCRGYLRICCWRADTRDDSEQNHLACHISTTVHRHQQYTNFSAQGTSLHMFA
jgi:hypothetical protein